MPVEPRALATRTREAQRRARVSTLRAKFNAAHVEGMEALRKHDYDALGHVIAEEKHLIDEQAELIAEHRRNTAFVGRRPGCFRSARCRGNG